MNQFDKKHPEHTADQTKQCICHGQQGLFLDKRNLSKTIAALVIVACFIFVGGYFWGQKTAIDQLLHSVERDSFADQIYYSMCSMYDQKDDESAEPDNGEEESTEQSGEQSGAIAPMVASEPAVAVVETPAQSTKKQLSHKRYMAPLAGYGSGMKTAAEQLVQRLQKRGITAMVKTRPSKTRSGKSIPWYQVVTQEYDSLDELQKVIAEIKKHERIHDIKITEVA